MGGDSLCACFKCLFLKLFIVHRFKVLVIYTIGKCSLSFHIKFHCLSFKFISNSNLLFLDWVQLGKQSTEGIPRFGEGRVHHGKQYL